MPEETKETKTQIIYARTPGSDSFYSALDRSIIQYLASSGCKLLDQKMMGDKIQVLTFEYIESDGDMMYLEGMGFNEWGTELHFNWI